MTLETDAVGSQVADGDVVAAFDEIDGERRLVIADIGQDDVWLSTAEGDAAPLEAWR